jgi:hypothetical protein
MFSCIHVVLVGTRCIIHPSSPRPARSFPLPTPVLYPVDPPFLRIFHSDSLTRWSPFNLTDGEENTSGRTNRRTEKRTDRRTNEQKQKGVPKSASPVQFKRRGEKYVRTDGETDERKDGRMDERTEERMNKRTKRRTNSQTDARMHERTDGRTDGRTDRRTYRRTDGRINRRTNTKRGCEIGLADYRCRMSCQTDRRTHERSEFIYKMLH